MKCSGFFILMVTVLLVFAAVVARAGQVNQVSLVEGGVNFPEIGAAAFSTTMGVPVKKIPCP